MKHVRTIVTEARDAARPHGISVDLVGGRKHLALEFRSASGGHRKIAVACSPRNEHEAIDNTRKYVRKIIQDMARRK